MQIVGAWHTRVSGQDDRQTTRIILRGDGTVQFDGSNVGGFWRFVPGGLEVSFHWRGDEAKMRRLILMKVSPDEYFGKQAMNTYEQDVTLQVLYSGTLPRLPLTQMSRGLTNTRHHGLWCTSWDVPEPGSKDIPVVFSVSPMCIFFDGRCVGGKWGWSPQSKTRNVFVVQFHYRGNEEQQRRVIFELNGSDLRAVEQYRVENLGADLKWSLPQRRFYQHVRLVFVHGLPPFNAKLPDEIRSVL